MSPQDWLHATAIRLTTPLLCRLYVEPYIVQVQLPLDASPHSQPEPDFAVVDQTMLNQRPHPRCPHLVMEVAQSSLRYDREVKANLYASMGIQEYWVLNVLDRQLEVFQQPVADPQVTFGFRYTRQHLCSEKEQIRALFAPEVEIPIHAMLPPPA